MVCFFCVCFFQKFGAPTPQRVANVYSIGILTRERELVTIPQIRPWIMKYKPVTTHPAGHGNRVLFTLCLLNNPKGNPGNVWSACACYCMD